MMKIGYLVWFDEDSRKAGEKPELWTREPDGWRVYVRIVYAEIQE